MTGHHVADGSRRVVVGHSCVYVKIGGADENHDHLGDGSRDCCSLRRGLSKEVHGFDDDGIRHHSCSGMYCFDGPDDGKRVQIRPGVRNSRHTYCYDHNP